jgi:hypothetical protein
MTIPDKFTKANEEHEEFLRQLGQLTLAWSDVESILFKLLKHYSGVTWPVARALFSGTRARSAMNFIQAIAENTKFEAARSDDLAEIFSHISSINSLRDFVVHHVDGSMIEFEDEDPTRRYVTDELRVSRESKTKTYLVGSSTLAAMRDDCEECCWRLHPHLDSQNEPFQAGSGRQIRRAWRFEPPKPAKTKKWAQ